jgi:hypothetical protein
MSKAVMQQALDALTYERNEYHVHGGAITDHLDKSIAALEAELAKPEPEPIGFLWRWKAKEHEPADVNPWQFRDVPVHPSNIDMLDLIPLYRGVSQAEYESMTPKQKAFMDAFS